MLELAKRDKIIRLIHFLQTGQATIPVLVCFRDTITEDTTMAQPWAKAFYNSSRWNKCRKSFIEHRRMIDGGTCQECHTNLGEIVHHRITLTEDNIKDDLVSLNFANLEYVCHKCHDEFEGHGLNGHGKIKPLCTFDSSGQPISLRDIDRPAPQEAASPQG